MRLAKFKSILAVLCLAAILFSMTPITAVAAYDNTYLNTGDRILDMIGVAKTQIGYGEDDNGITKYGTYLGWPDMDWCAAFVAWCAAQADVNTRIIPAESSCTRMKNFFKSRDLYYESASHGGSYQPKAGDLAFFSSRSDPDYITHIGLVTAADANKIYTIEGNYEDRVKELSYTYAATKLVGFAAPAYDTSEFRTGFYTLRENTALRSSANGAGTANIISNLSKGTQIKVTSISGSWGVTEYAGKTGWIQLSECDYDRALKNTVSLAAQQNENPLFLVIDVSRFTPPSAIDWEAIKAAGVQAAILRVGGRGYGEQKRLYNDVAFTQHYKNATAAGLAVGVYFFSYALTEAQAREEAEMTIRILKENDAELRMPVFIDIEDYQEDDYMDYQHENAGIDVCSMVVDTFCNTVAAAGYFPGVYCNKYFAEHLLHPSVFENRAVWIAHYGVTKCGYKGRYDLWQYTGSGRLDGYAGLLDISYCYVDFPSMIGNEVPAGDHGTHIPNDDWEIIDPTCSKEGKRILRCKDCGIVLLEEVLRRTDHTSSVKYLFNSNTSFKVGDQIPSAALNEMHAEDDEYYADTYYPFYQRYGGTLLTYCTECQKILSTEYSYGEGSHGHVNTETTPATCAAEGAERRVCADCGRTVSETLLPLLSHTPGESTLRITTCTQDGARITQCAVCGEAIRTTFAPAGTHRFDAGRQAEAPTLKTPGTFVYTCTICGEQKTEEIPSPLYGDVDGDGDVTATDARLALRAAIRLENLTEQQLIACDANHTGKIESADARIILRVAVKLDSVDDMMQKYYP